MARKYDLPDPTTLEVAPHRYLWNDPLDERRSFLAGERGAQARREFRELIPYKQGEVVYVVYGDTFAKAYISEVLVGYDRFSDKREQYRVHRLNADGKRFSKRWYYAYPGYVQQGYKRAGLAPDVLD